MPPEKDTRTDFSKKVVALIKKIPKGKVATYGLIADLAGDSGRARWVGWLLHSSTRKYNLPWQRVIKSGGLLSFPELTRKYARQKNLLEQEGVIVKNGRVNLRIYLWNGKTRSKKD